MTSFPTLSSVVGLKCPMPKILCSILLTNHILKWPWPFKSWFYNELHYKTLSFTRDWNETSVILPSHKQAMQWTAGKKQRSDSLPQTSASDWTAVKAPFSPTSWTKAQSLTSTTLTRHQTTAMSLSGKVRTLGMCLLVTVCWRSKLRWT